MQHLSLATLNTFTVTFNFPNLLLRFRVLTHYFNHSSIHVLNLQEVFTYAHFHLLKSQLSKFPFCCYESALLGPKGGLVIFSRFPVQKRTYRTFDTTLAPLGKATLEKLTQKGMLVAFFVEAKLLLISTHLSAVIDDNYSSKGKYTQVLSRQIQQIHELLAEYADTASIITGDFNLAKESHWYSVLLHKNQLSDVFSEELGCTLHPEFLSQSSKAHWIDYILLHPGKKWLGKVKSKKILFQEKVILSKQQRGFVSDHKGLQVDITLP